MKRIITAAIFHFCLAAMGGTTADLAIHRPAHLLSGQEAKALIQADFLRFDSTYLEHQSSLGERLITLGKQLAEMQATGNALECSSEIYLEAKWLHRYTTYWDDLKQRLDDLEKSFNDLHQDYASQQSSETGLWGACYKRAFFKIEATMLALIDLETAGKSPEYQVHMPPPFDTFENSLDHFKELLVSDIGNAGLDNRGELGNLSTVAALLYFKGHYQGYVREVVGIIDKHDKVDVKHIEDSEAFAHFIDAWQDPMTGYWGAWYSSNGKLYKTADLSVTFHIISYRGGQVDHWPAIIQTTFAIAEQPYPFGWRHEGGFTNHNNYDVAKILSYGWPHMTPEQRRKAAVALEEMLRWTLSTSLQADGSFRTVPTFFSSTAADFYFGVSFLQTIGFWDVKKRFWTQRAFPEAQAVCRRIKAQLTEIRIKSHESELALKRLEDGC